tara:strand:- start:704 stop:808 length:105 start_codon:yes stop_codon:yes gene_type:complete
VVEVVVKLKVVEVEQVVIDHPLLAQVHYKRQQNN